MSSKGSSADPLSPQSDVHSTTRAVYKPPSLRSCNNSIRSATPVLSMSFENDNNDDLENMMNVSEVSEVKGEANVSSEPFSMKSFKGRPSSCLFVASLSAARSDDQLSSSIAKCFRQWGELVMVKVLRDTSNRPYAFVQYTNDEDASRALGEAPQTILDGRAIRCEAAKVNRTLYVSTSRDQLLSEREIRGKLNHYGEIEQAVGTGAFARKTGSAFGEQCYSAWFCKFAFRDDAVRAYANLRTNPNWIVEWAQNIESSKNTAEITIDRRSVFVGQLDPNVTREILLERFTRHGHIEFINLVSRPGNTFAFLKYETEQAAAAAVEMENHSLLLDRTMHVQYREINHTPLRGRREPLLKLAPPPVNLPVKGLPLKRQTSYQSSAPPKSPLSNYFSSRKASYNEANVSKKAMVVDAIKSNEVLDLLASQMEKKLAITPFSSPAKLDENSSVKFTGNVPKSGSETHTSFTALSSNAERKSLYSAATSGGFLDFGGKNEVLTNATTTQAPYCYYYPTTGHSDVYHYVPNGPNGSPSGNCYFPPNYSFYYENGVVPGQNDLPQSGGYTMYYGNHKSAKPPVNSQYVPTLESQKENRAPEI